MPVSLYVLPAVSNALPVGLEVLLADRNFENKKKIK